MKFFRRLVLFVLLIVLAAPYCFAQLTANRSGRLDREYAQDGIGIYASATFYGNSIVLGDGSLFQVSTAEAPFPSFRYLIELRKFTENGSPDTSFGNQGRKTYDFGHEAGGNAVASLSDGKLLIAGSINQTGVSNELDFLVFRIHPNGDLDTSFGDNGLFVKNFQSSNQNQATLDSIDSIQLLADGRILANGTSTQVTQTPNGSSQSRTLRLTPNGSIDASFGGDGSNGTEIGYQDYLPAGGRRSIAALDLQGRQVVGVVSYSDANTPTFSCRILRYLPNGSLDPNFAEDGVLVFTPGQASSCTDFAFSPDGKVLVLTGWSLMRLNEDGSVDMSFANSGVLSLLPAFFVDMFLGENGKIYLAGYQFVSTPSGQRENALLKSFHSNGAPDLRFGTAGTTRSPISTLTSSVFMRMHVLNNKTLLVTGLYSAFPPRQLMLSRFTFAR